MGALYGYVSNTNSWIDVLGLSGGNATSWNEFQIKIKGWFESRQRVAEDWRVYKDTAFDPKEIAIGRLADTKVAQSLGMQILDSNYWSPQVNDAWVLVGIDAEKKII